MEAVITTETDTMIRNHKQFTVAAAAAVAAFALTGCGAFINTGKSNGFFGLGAEVPPGGATDDDPAGDDSSAEVPPATDDDDDAPDVDDDNSNNNACGECKFDRYNLDVRVGDTFVLANFVGCLDPLSSHSFEMDGGDWAQLDAINSGLPITITEDDKSGGNHGDGEYRLNLVDENGHEVDHMTIRIDHDDVSDIRAADAVAHAPAGCDAGAAGDDPAAGGTDPAGDAAGGTDPAGDDGTDPAGDDAGGDAGGATDPTPPGPIG